MKKNKGSLAMFLRRNAVYLVLGLCILAVGLSITFMLLTRENDLSLKVDNSEIVEPAPDDKPTGSPDDENTIVDKPLYFIVPIENPTSVVEYSETMVYNSTLNRYSAHLAVDYFAPEGTNVLAVFDGSVLSVETTFLQGTTITIDHGNGLYSIYNSLEDGESVSVGQKVCQGDVIGQVSNTNRQEYKDGAHLHFEVRENGKLIDPAKYLESQEK